MKKKSLLWISVFLLMLAGCSSDDNDTIESTLYYKTWKLVSYGNESSHGLTVSTLLMTQGRALIQKYPGGISGLMMMER